jgi:hypothetical protein
MQYVSSPSLSVCRFVFDQKRQLSSFILILSPSFALSAPTVAFGGLTNIITDGHIGVIEFIISCGAGGMFYSLFSGQPMTFVGPTGAVQCSVVTQNSRFICLPLSLSLPRSLVDFSLVYLFSFHCYALANCVPDYLFL